MGAPEAVWGNRPERLLTAAVLRVDLTAIATPPLDVKTEEGGTYNPFAPLAPVKIYASGVRNAYDLVWHTNGQLYVPTNGSNPGGNTPASPDPLPASCLTRVDSASNGPYTGPQVPGLTNVTQVQNDFLFRVEPNGYYGHPNPQRCEWVLNGGNPTAGIDTAEVTAYPVGTQPDRNWRGSAFDFGQHRSPNGVIEYRKDTFGGALQGKLLVARYSQGDDIIALTPGGPNMDIVGSETGIAGFTGFTDPLDLVENRATGDIYVTEHAAQKITLLRPLEGYVRPVAATPTTVRLVPAFSPCIAANAVHGPPLEHPSCNPAVASSAQLTVGTPDANGKAAKSSGLVKLRVVGEGPVDPNNGDQADVLITTSMTDVRHKSDLSDYAGELEGRLTLRITDRLNGVAADQPGTVDRPALPVRYYLRSHAERSDHRIFLQRVDVRGHARSWSGARRQAGGVGAWSGRGLRRRPRRPRRHRRQRSLRRPGSLRSLIGRGASGWLLSPRADAAHPLDGDPHPDARRRIVHRRKAHRGAEIHVRKLLQQLGSSALLDRGPAMHDEVLEQAGWLDLGSFERDRHTGIAPDVLELSQPRIQVRGEQVVSLDGNPHARHLRAAVRVGGDQMAERA